MVFQNYPFFYLFFLSSFISGCTAYYAWKRRTVRSARTFSILMVFVTWWVFFYGFEVIMAQPGLQFFFLQIEYLAIPWISGLLIWCSLEFGGYEKYCTKKNLLILFIIPALIFFSFFTNRYLHLYYQDVSFLVIDNLMVMSITPNIMYRLLDIANIGSIIFCLIIIIRVFYQVPRIFRPQMLLSLCALILILTGLVVYIFLPRMYPNFDISSISISLVGLVFLTAIFRYQFFDLINIPYHSIFENLEEGIMVLDSKNRILEINKKAATLLTLDSETVLGKELASVDTFLKEHNLVLTGDAYAVIRTNNMQKGGEFSFFVEMYPVLDTSSRLQCRMIIIRDITDLAKTNKALSEAGKKLNLLNSVTRHDILNQVAIISGYVDLISDSPPGDANSQILLERIKNASDSIQKLIRFTATYQDLGVSEPVWQNVSWVAKKAWNTLHPPDSISLHITTDVVLFADMLLEKVFFNLMENSLRHGGTVTDITISSCEQDKKTILVYEDNGCGIEPEHKKNVFSRGIGKNTGFGLFLVSEILSITSIEIHETGTYESGVRFEMTIPRGGAKKPDAASGSPMTSQ